MIDLDDVLPVSNKSVSRNLKLLQLSDDLTQQMEDISRGKTTDIRTIQLTAITLALLNFIFIVFKFIRQLNESDRRAETAQEETKQILDTVHQGLFLLHADGRIGDQRSASLEQLFGQTLRPQLHFVDEVLKPNIKDEDLLETASGYISTLFDKKIKPSLLARLNPLVEIEIDTPSDKRQQKKYLSFAFEQVKKNDEVTSLL
ncbi:MAG: chemotaxis protein CheA, partial [Deltaproteobacteria bacterium]|nr:chemotaxis protein CheA [Deltaproteobacteria bacterium]